MGLNFKLTIIDLPPLCSKYYAIVLLRIDSTEVVTLKKLTKYCIQLEGFAQIGHSWLVCKIALGS